MKMALSVILFFLLACTGKRQSLLNQQKEISLEIEQVKATYYKTTDSLDRLRRNDTTATRQSILMEAVVAADKKKSAALLTLEKKYHMLELKLRNYTEE